MAQIWAFIAAIFIIVVPLITEGMDIVKTYKQNTAVHSELSLKGARLTSKPSHIKPINDGINITCNGLTSNATKYENMAKCTPDIPSCSDGKDDIQQVNLV